jgi:hypothetical protein
MKMMITFSSHTRRSSPAAVLSVATMALLAMVVGVGPTVASASGASKVCNETGVTRSAVRKAFGPTARIGGEGVSESGRCPIESGLNGKPPSECLDGLPACLDTDVLVTPAHDFKADVESKIEELDSYGHARKTPFSGAGSGAVLLTSNDYGEVTNPAVIFEAGPKTVFIEGPFGGQGETPKVYKQWEALARTIHAHLS